MIVWRVTSITSTTCKLRPDVSRAEAKRRNRMRVKTPASATWTVETSRRATAGVRADRVTWTATMRARAASNACMEDAVATEFEISTVCVGLLSSGTLTASTRYDFLLSSFTSKHEPTFRHFDRCVGIRATTSVWIGCWDCVSVERTTSTKFVTRNVEPRNVTASSGSARKRRLNPSFESPEVQAISPYVFSLFIYFPNQY